MFNRFSIIGKILIFDLAKREEDSFTYTMNDLEACYDRQLPNIGRIVEESIGVNKERLKLVTCENFIGNTYSISKHSYGGMNEVLGGIGQDFFPGSTCRDVLCFVFKETKKKYYEEH